MSASDDALLDEVAQSAALPPATASLLVGGAGAPPAADGTAALWALLRGYRQVRDLLATARQAIQSIRQKDTAQDTAIAQLQADVAALRAKVGL